MPLMTFYEDTRRLSDDGRHSCSRALLVHVGLLASWLRSHSFPRRLRGLTCSWLPSSHGPDILGNPGMPEGWMSSGRLTLGFERPATAEMPIWFKEERIRSLEARRSTTDSGRAVVVGSHCIEDGSRYQLSVHWQYAYILFKRVRLE